MQASAPRAFAASISSVTPVVTSAPSITTSTGWIFASSRIACSRSSATSTGCPVTPRMRCTIRWVLRSGCTMRIDDARTRRIVTQIPLPPRRLRHTRIPQNSVAIVADRNSSKNTTPRSPDFSAAFAS